MRKVFMFLTVIVLFALSSCSIESDLEKCISNDECDYFLITPLIKDEDSFWKNFKLRGLPHTDRVIVNYQNYDLETIRIYFNPYDKPSIDDLDSFIDTFEKFGKYTQNKFSEEMSVLMSIKVEGYTITYLYNTQLSIFIQINLEDFDLTTTLGELELINDSFKELSNYHSLIQVNIRHEGDNVEIITLEHDNSLLTSTLIHKTSTTNVTDSAFIDFFNNHFTEYTNTIVISEFED